MVTKADIARTAGVSRTCVSLVLNDRPGVRIAPATRQRVLEAARRLGYQPASASVPAQTATAPIATGRDGAVREVPGAPGTILYLLGTGGKPIHHFSWHLGLLDELQHCVTSDERALVYLSGTDTSAGLVQTMRAIDRVGPLGIVLDGLVSEALVRKLQQRGQHFVVAGITPFAHDPAWRDKVNTVSVDVADGMARLVRWMSEHGARTIAFASGGLHLPVNRLLIHAFRQVVDELGLVYHPGLVQVCTSDVDGRHLLARFADLGVEYDGLIVGSVGLAHQVLHVRQTASVQPSRQPLTAMIGPGGPGEPVPPDVAAMHVDCADFGRRAYELLCAQIRYPKRKPRHVQVAFTLQQPQEQV